MPTCRAASTLASQIVDEDALTRLEAEPLRREDEDRGLRLGHADLRGADDVVEEIVNADVRLEAFAQRVVGIAQDGELVEAAEVADEVEVGLDGALGGPPLLVQRRQRPAGPLLEQPMRGLAPSLPITAAALDRLPTSPVRYSVSNTDDRGRPWARSSSRATSQRMSQRTPPKSKTTPRGLVIALGCSGLRAGSGAFTAWPDVAVQRGPAALLHAVLVEDLLLLVGARRRGRARNPRPYSPCSACTTACRAVRDPQAVTTRAHATSKTPKRSHARHDTMPPPCSTRP